jgi:hypothetical protein
MEPTSPTSPTSAPAKEPRLILRKILFAFGTIALVALYGLFRHRLKTDPLYSSLVVTGVWGATAVAGLWFLGREKQPMVRAWRIAFLVIAASLLPVILNITDGIVEHGWPSGRSGKPIARVLKLLIPLAASAFLTGLVAHLRTYRPAAVLAILTGITSLVLGPYLIPATKSFIHLSITLGEVLNNTMFVAKLETYAAIPLGVAFIVGGILTWRAAVSVLNR